METSRPHREKDPHRAHYTSAPELTALMTSRLEVTDADIVWEPTAGAGHLIDAVLAVAPRAEIHASELRFDTAQELEAKYRLHPGVTVHQEDALEVEAGSQSSLFAPTRRPPTRIIANPPYGAWQTPERRAALKRRFPGLYVRETYSTILHHCLTCLSPGGRLVFLIPDTFLWLHRHESLRRRLFEDFRVVEVVRFPSRFFPGVAFGYSGMCVITVVARRPGSRAVTRIVDGVTEVADLGRLARSTAYLRSASREVPQASLLSSPVKETSEVGACTLCSVGDLAEVRTGFYSGNDRRWVRRLGPEVKRSTCYLDVGLSQIAARDEGPPLSGIDGPRHFIPIVRGGAASFVKPDEWYLDWSVAAVSEYKRPGKNPARFQNAAYYFRQGIGVPMVASSRLTACLLDGRLFDQGIVGVFPRDPAHLFYLLGFLNTRCATGLLRAINATANNSANYVKRIPLPPPTEAQLDEVNSLVVRAIGEAQQGRIEEPTAAALESLYRELFALTGHEPSGGWAPSPARAPAVPAPAA